MCIVNFTSCRCFVSDQPILSEFSTEVTTLVQLMWCNGFGRRSSGGLGRFNELTRLPGLVQFLLR